MDTLPLNHLKKELLLTAPQDLVDICLKLAKYKKENKELLHYLLYHAHNEIDYIATVKREISLYFKENTLYGHVLTKKQFQKIIKTTNKYIKYSPHKNTEVELRIHLSREIKNTENYNYGDRLIENYYDSQIVKIKKAIEKLHEDLQYDYLEELKTFE